MEKQGIEADVTHKVSQERIDAIVRAHERVVVGATRLPEGVLAHLERAISSSTMQLPEKTGQGDGKS